MNRFLFATYLLTKAAIRASRTPCRSLKRKSMHNRSSFEHEPISVATC